MSVEQILPWQTRQWQALQGSHQQDRLAHGQLFCGPSGTGKRQFAIAVAHGLLCRQPKDNGQACGACAACSLLRAGTHPDLLIVEAEDENKPIKVDQIRELVDYLSLTSHEGGKKITLVLNADRMNVNAANSLLKTLEEPPSAKTLLILTASQISALPATVRSRCQRIEFPLPPRAQAIQWLRSQNQDKNAELILSLAQGAPLTALQLGDEALLEQRSAMLSDLRELQSHKTSASHVAERWFKIGTRRALEWFSIWLSDLARLKICDQISFIENHDQRQLLTTLSRQTPLQGLLELYRDVLKGRSDLERNANAQLLLDGLLIQWKRLST